jgi:RHS repeat-associated protein
VQDRIGTNRATGARYYPFGDEITSTANDATKFGTYHRDGFTGLDYADQRYYASGYGRFNTPDPYRASAGLGDPGSWNRFAYVGGDPVNRFDPFGLSYVGVGDGVDESSVQCDDDGNCSFYDNGEDFDGSDDVSVTMADNGTVTFGIDVIGLNAPPMTSDQPNPYSLTDTYAGISAQCMFWFGGDGPWGNTVRGCLATMYQATPPGTPYNTVSDMHHQFCYWSVGLARTGVLNTIVGFLGAVGVAPSCVSGITLTPIPTILPYWLPSPPAISPQPVRPTPARPLPGRPVPITTKKPRVYQVAR